MTELRLIQARRVSTNGDIGAIPGQIVSIPAGSVATGDNRLSLETSGNLPKASEFEHLLIAIPDLGLIRLCDVEEVWRGLETPASAPVFRKGASAIVLGVLIQVGQDITRLGRTSLSDHA